MSFLEEFDRHAGGEKPVETEGQNRELLEFADLIRRNRALPDPAERERIMARVRRAHSA